MHRSKIEWCDDTWNPVTGCLNQCHYCYAKKSSVRFSGDIKRNMTSPRYEKGEKLQILDDPFVADTGGILNYPFGFIPTYHKYRLNYPEQRKNGCNILVGEMGEMFGNWVPDEVLNEVFEACKKQDIHNYIFLTRHPDRYRDLYQKGILPPRGNFWYGCTATDQEALSAIPTIPAAVNTFVCVEPIQREIKVPGNNIYLTDWIIIGAETGNSKNKVTPRREWIESIVDYADRVGVPVFMKESLRGIMGAEFKQEFPNGLKERKMSPKLVDRLEGDCCKCGKHMRKNKMIALCGRSMRGEQPKQFGLMCKQCFMNLCAELHIEIPKLKNLKEDE